MLHKNPLICFFHSHDDNVTYGNEKTLISLTQKDLRTDTKRKKIKCKDHEEHIHFFLECLILG